MCSRSSSSTCLSPAYSAAAARSPIDCLVMGGQLSQRPQDLIGAIVFHSHHADRPHRKLTWRRQRRTTTLFGDDNRFDHRKQYPLFFGQVWLQLGPQLVEKSRDLRQQRDGPRSGFCSDWACVQSAATCPGSGW